MAEAEVKTKLRGDEYFRLGADFAHLQIAITALEEIDLEKSELTLKDDFGDALIKLTFIQDVMYKIIVKKLVEAVENE